MNDEKIMEYLFTSISSAIGIAVLVFVFKNWFLKRLNESISQEYRIELERFKSELSTQIHQRNEVWITKRDACLKAMNLANAILSNYEYPNVKKEDLKPQFETVEAARACYNELACTCESPDVLDQLKIIISGAVSPDAIVDLRNAVRKELGFTKGSIDNDREKSFLGKINCEPGE